MGVNNGGTMRGVPIKRDQIHNYLWNNSDSVGRIRIIQKDLATKLDLAHETVCRNLKTMVTEGRLRKLRSEKNNVGVYVVMDPVAWAAEQEEEQEDVAEEAPELTTPTPDVTVVSDDPDVQAWLNA